MEMRKLIVVFLLLDALLVLILGAITIHGDHGWDFFWVNGVRLAVMGTIVALWRTGSSKRLERVLFGRPPPQESGPASIPSDPT